MGETMTPARLKIYAGDLVDLERAQLEAGFLRARRECRFFPKIAELRALAGVGKESEQLEVEAQAAFQAVIRHLEREGVMAGIKGLPERVRYAVRQCGGLDLFNLRLQVRYGDDENPSGMDDRGPQFLQRDFLKAYKDWDVYCTMADELERKLLPPKVQAFLTGNTQAATRPIDPPRVLRPIEKPAFTKKTPAPLSDEQVRDRREMLKQQAELLKTKRA